MQEMNEEVKQGRTAPKFKSKFSILNAPPIEQAKNQPTGDESPISQYLNVLRSKPIINLSQKKEAQDNVHIKMSCNTSKQNNINLWNSAVPRPGIYLVKKTIELDKDIDKIELFKMKTELNKIKQRRIQEPGLFQLAIIQKKQSNK